jgi:hypothetical protein
VMTASERKAAASASAMVCVFRGFVAMTRRGRL